MQYKSIRCRILFWSIFDCVLCLALLDVNRNNKYSTDKYHFFVAKTLSWLLFILTFKYDTPHAVKGDKSYACESCHFASHTLDRFCNWCKPGSRKCKSNGLSLVAMSRQISVTHSLCSRHILVRSTSRETYFLCFFSNIACVAGACLFRAKGEISRGL